MRILKPHQNQGFTIVELMIATTVFSVILMIATFGLLQVGRMYYKGITMSRVHETTRTVMSEIAQNIQYSGTSISGTTAASPGVNKLCLGNRRYSYIEGRLVSETPTAGQFENALVQDIVANCASSSGQVINVINPTLTAGSKELLQPGMRLSRLSVTDLGNGLYSIVVRVVYGTDELLENPNATNAQCRNLAIGSRFCAAAQLETTVLKRVNVE